MNEMLYVAMTGAKQTEYAQAINSNNLANVSTTGFRADLHSFRAIPVEGPGVGSRVNAVIENSRTDTSQGSVINTGRDLDVAIQGRGYLAVLGPDGDEAYTRSGDLRINAGGLLTNGAGHLIVGDGGPVAIPPNTNLLIGSDGTISIQPLGQGPEAMAIVDRIRLVDMDESRLRKAGDGLLHLPKGEVAESSSQVRLTAGALEQSNVNIAKTLVNMIELSRQYEMQVNVMKTAKEDADAAAQMLRIG